jgi:hypothetical protein
VKVQGGSEAGEEPEPGVLYRDTFMIAIQSQGTEPGANSTRYDEKELYLFQVNYKCLRTPCFDSIEGSDALGHEEDLSRRSRSGPPNGRRGADPRPGRALTRATEGGGEAPVGSTSYSSVAV